MSGRAGVGGNGHSHVVIILLSVIVGIGLAALWYHPRATSAQPQAPPPRLQAIEDDFVAIAERAKQAVVKINAHTFTDRGEQASGLEERWREFFGQPPFFREPRGGGGAPAPPRRPVERTSQGSGFFFKEDGYILTNNHVVAGAKKIVVELLDGREFDAKLIGTDKKTELAVLKIDGAGDHEYLALADSDTARVGSWAIAIGMPFREAWSVTHLPAAHRSDPDGCGHQPGQQRRAAAQHTRRGHRHQRSDPHGRNAAQCRRRVRRPEQHGKDHRPAASREGARCPGVSGHRVLGFEARRRGGAEGHT